MQDDAVANSWDVFSESCILFIPTFAILIIESAASLQICRVTRRIPTVVASQGNDGRGTHFRRQTRLALVVKFSMLVVLVLKSIWHPNLPKHRNEQSADLQRSILSLDIDFLASVYLIGNMFCTIIGCTARTIYRGERGRHTLAFTSLEGYSELLRILIYVAVAVFVIGAYIQDQGTLTAVLRAAVLHFFIVNILQRFKTRYYMIPVFAIAVTCLGMRTLFSPERSFTSSLSTSEDAMQIDWLSIMTGGFASATPYSFVASCYRYDFAHDRQIKYEDAYGDLLIPTRSLSSAPGHIRVLDPSKRFWPSFQRPYFYAALTGWLSSHIIIAFLDTRWGLPLKPSALALSLGVACLAPVCMRLTVFALSVMRGERQLFWNYKEDWGYKEANLNGVSIRGAASC